MSSPRTPGRCAVILLLVLAGCADSEPLADESAGEKYLQERLERLHPSLASHQIAVFCRPDGGGRLACRSSVSTATDQDALRQRWVVALNSSGRVLAATAVSPPSVAETREAATEAGRATTRRRPAHRRRARKRVRVVWIRVAPRRPAVVCVDTGRARVRVRLRRRSTVMHAEAPPPTLPQPPLLTRTRPQ